MTGQKQREGLKALWATGAMEAYGDIHTMKKFVFRFLFTWICLVHIVVKSLSHVGLFCDPMDYSPPGSTVHGISQASIVEWLAVSFFRWSSWNRDWTCISLNWQVVSWPLSHQGSLPSSHRGSENMNKNIMKCLSLSYACHPQRLCLEGTLQFTYTNLHVYKLNVKIWRTEVTQWGSPPARSPRFWCTLLSLISCTYLLFT